MRHAAGLAGHSYGGSLMSEAADGHPRVRALVYVASFLLEEGESTGELAARFPGARLGAALESVPSVTADGRAATDLYIRQEEFRAVFAADVPADVAARMAVTQRPVVADALEEKAIPAESMRLMAERAASHTVEVDASHAVTVSQSEAVARLIEEAARATVV